MEQLQVRITAAQREYENLLNDFTALQGESVEHSEGIEDNAIKLLQCLQYLANFSQRLDDLQQQMSALQDASNMSYYRRVANWLTNLLPYRRRSHPQEQNHTADEVNSDDEYVTAMDHFSTK